MLDLLKFGSSEKSALFENYYAMADIIINVYNRESEGEYPIEESSIETAYHLFCVDLFDIVVSINRAMPESDRSFCVEGINLLSRFMSARNTDTLITFKSSYMDHNDPQTKIK